MRVSTADGLRYLLLPSPFGALGLAWRETESGPRVQRVFLPEKQTPALERLKQALPQATPGSVPQMDDMGRRIQAALEGQSVAFPLDRVALDACRPFQKSVLLAERQIPRGRVTTYSRLAVRLGQPLAAARAVGHASARNPFSIIIPCHRVVGSNGELNGYQGGLRMKRALLEMEGVEFTPAGRVVTNSIDYDDLARQPGGITE
jgi:methylated-DNA-[protein]-cysteine S-methyltransferase